MCLQVCLQNKRWGASGGRKHNIHATHVAFTRRRPGSVFETCYWSVLPSIRKNGRVTRGDRQHSSANDHAVSLSAAPSDWIYSVGRRRARRWLVVAVAVGRCSICCCFRSASQTNRRHLWNSPHTSTLCHNLELRLCTGYSFCAKPAIQGTSWANLRLACFEWALFLKFVKVRKLERLVAVVSTAVVSQHRLTAWKFFIIKALKDDFVFTNVI